MDINKKDSGDNPESLASNTEVIIAENNINVKISSNLAAVLTLK